MLVSTLLHATVYMFLHNLLNVLVQIANKMGLQQQKLVLYWQFLIVSQGRLYTSIPSCFLESHHVEHSLLHNSLRKHHN
jgi:hypothetical protein